MKIVVDFDTIKALSVSTRLDILELLKEKDMTLSELSSALDLKKSTLKDHLDKLLSSGLIEKEDTSRKWKYYSLTKKGRAIVCKRESNVLFALFASVVFAFISAFIFFYHNFKVGNACRTLAVAHSLSRSAPTHVVSHFYLYLFIISLIILVFVIVYALMRWKHEK